MALEYDLVDGVSEEEFRKNVKSVEELRADDAFRKASVEDLRQVEELLDVQSGTLKDLEFFVRKASCSNCGKEIGMTDVVRTALNDAQHSKSAILHTLVGNKYIVDRPRQVRCSSCDTAQDQLAEYASIAYGCGHGLKSKIA